MKKKTIIKILCISFVGMFFLYQGSHFLMRRFNSNDRDVWNVDRDMEFNFEREPGDLEGLEINRVYYGTENYELWVGGFAGESYDMEIPYFRMETSQDRLNASINNTTSHRFNAILKVFYNYEEVEFRISGSDVYNTEFLFAIEPGYYYQIPFHLDPDLEAHDGFSKLTLAVYFQPDEYAMFQQSAHYMPATALNFEINYGGDNPPEIEKFTHEIIEKPTWHGVGNHNLIITQSGDLTYENIGHPGRPLKVKAGERIELDFATNMSGIFRNSFTTNYIPTTDYLIIGLLDFNQVQINGRPFLWVPVDNDVTHFGSFYFYAPMEEGLYDFNAIIIPNPTMQMSWDSFLPLERSMRFTIEVVAQ